MESGHCWRQCGDLPADHCNPSYWLETVTEVKSMLAYEINDSFVTLYSGNIPAECNTRDKNNLQILLGASKKAITKKWFNKEPPTKAEWITTVNGDGEPDILSKTLYRYIS